jgi:hypothetical protein
MRKIMPREAGQVLWGLTELCLADGSVLSVWGIREPSREGVDGLVRSLE